MRDDQVPIEMVSELLLPVSLRAEMCITSVTVSPDNELLTFRLDPGNAFERRGYIRSAGGGRFLIGMAERYLPDGERAHVCGSDGLPAGDVPDQLRAASGWAYTWDGERDHWLDARAPLSPACSRRCVSLHVAQSLARELEVAHYVSLEAGKLICANNPPRDWGLFFSVTNRGDWSLHRGPETYPLESIPDAETMRQLASGAVASVGRPVRVTRVEHPWESAAVVVPLSAARGSRPSSARTQRRRRL